MSLFSLGVIMSLTVFLMAVLSVALNALAQIALRKMAVSLPPLSFHGFEALVAIPSIILNIWFLVGMTFYAVSIGLWIFVLGRSEVSLAYPLLSIGYVFTAIIGYYFLGENVSLMRVVGIAVICIGVIIVSRSA